MVLVNDVGNFQYFIIVFWFSYTGNDYLDNEENSCIRNLAGRSSDIDIPHGQGALLECKGGGCILINKVIEKFI